MKKILLFTCLLFSTVVFAQHPNNLNTTNITFTTADLSWDASPCGSTVNLKIRTVPGNWQAPILGVTSTYTLIGLTSGTAYAWTVKCVGQSGWQTEEQFTTSTIPITYNCVNGTCTDPLDGTGIYNTIGVCQSSCQMPTIASIEITDSIYCFDSLATIKITINQSSPPVIWKPILGYYLGAYFVSFGSSDAGTGTYVNLPGIEARIDWVVRLVDSIPYYAANPNGSGTSMTGVFDESAPFAIIEPAQLVAVTTNVLDSINSCFGDCDAQLEVVISGGTEPYNYTLDANPTVTVGAQSYTINTVGNTFSPSSLTINIGDTITWNNTGGSHNVNATLATYPSNPEGFGNAVAGFPWTFQWVFTLPGTYDYQCDPHLGVGMIGVIIVNSAPSNTTIIDTLINLCEGNYNLLVSDANGCLTDPSPKSFIITAPPVLVPAGAPYFYDLNSLHISCFGANDGFMVLIDPNTGLDLTTGGTGPYTFAVDNGPFGDENSLDSITGSFTGILHTIYYRDDNGCLDSVDFTFNEPAILDLYLVLATPASCYGVLDGVISVGQSGGAGNELYSTDTTGNSYPYNTGVISSLLGDSTYEVFVKDGNGCIDSIHVPLSQPTEIVYSTVLSDYNGFEISCYGVADGEITFNQPVGGNGSYSYSCVPNGNAANYVLNSVYLGLSAGIYDLSVRDGGVCTKDTTIVLSSPGPFTITASLDTNYNGSDVSCKTACDGEISVTSLNGVNVITYEFDNSGGFSLIEVWDSLCAGSYSIDALDENLCSANTSITIVDPPTLTATSSSADEFCNAMDGTASVTPNGGTGSYSYFWTGPNSYTSTNQNITFLDAGIYSCIITDENGCTITDSEVVLDDIPFELSLTTTPTCPGNNSGSANVLVTALGSHTLSTPIYQWDDPNSQTTPTAANLVLGTYIVTVEDPGIPGCIISATVDIDTTLLSVSIANIEISHISCHNADDGTITIHATGGTSPYLYAITDPSTGNLGVQQNDSCFGEACTPSFGLIEWAYTIEVEDVSGCTTSTVVNITNPPSLYIDTTMVNPIQCNGESNASIQAIIAVGGTPPYEYSVNGGFSHTNMSYFINYGAGTYSIEVQDVNNCFSQDIVVIEEPPVLAVTITPSLWNNYQVRCYGDTNSYANIATTGGESPYYYICIDGLGDTIYQGGLSTVSNLSQGTYGFYTIDALGCTSSESVVYNEPSIIEHNFIPTHVTCNGWNNGSLIDSIYGGVGGSINAYSYLWDTGEITYAIDSIPIGDYIVTVTDMNNCISTDTFVSINDNNALIASVDLISTTNVSCYNYCDGEIVISVSGGIPNINSFGDSIYYYLWDDTLSQTTQSATGLCVDNTTNSTTYSCIITDLQGCNTAVSYTITQEDAIEVDASIVTEILCFEGNNGKLTVLASGGAGSFTYMWSNNSPTYSTNPINNNIPAGNYIITVKDQNGCFGSDSIILTQPDEITLSVSNTNISCFGFGDGTILADADGGTPFLGIPPEYQYIFYNESGTQIDDETAVTSQTEELIPGIYTVIAKDMNGCTVESGTIYISQPGDALTISFSTLDATCMQNNGWAKANVDGGTSPFQYNWDNGQTADEMFGLESGYYPILITDANNCIIRDSAFVIGVHNVFLPNNLSAIEHTICLGDSVYLDIDEHAGTTYQWENGSTVADRWVYPDKRENIYILTILDVGCSETYSVYATIHVNFVDALPTSIPGVEYGNYPIIVNGDQIQIFSDNNDCDSYEWAWEGDTDLNQSIIDNPDVSTWYYINVDSADCLGYDSIYVVVGVLPYEGITPNGDGYNDIWTPVDIESYPEAIVQVFNRWGAIVFESSGGSDYQAWDGTNKGKELPVGTYYYIIDLKTTDEPQTGPITIIR